MIKIELPKDVCRIIRALEDGGFEAYVVGGCVRDAVMGISPKDWDITTSAKPQEVKSIFRRTIDTGIQHGTVAILSHGTVYEVTTYRIDGEYRDSRHPESVSFTSDLEEDLMRRDFTMNAMAYHPEKGFQDPYQGLQDIRKRVIRCVGEATRRFEEDALRILRGIRFSGQLGFTIEEDTYEAMRARAGGLLKISAERIRDELFKTLCSDRPEQLVLLKDLHILTRLLPDFTVGDYAGTETADMIFERIREAVDEIERLALLFQGFGVPSRPVMRALRFDNARTDEVERLILGTECDPPQNDRDRRMLLHRFGPETGLRILDLLYICGTVSWPAERLAAERAALRKVSEEQPWRLSDLSIGGKDIVSLGLRGPAVGEALDRCLKTVLNHPELNYREELLRRCLPEDSDSGGGYES